jgi:hypothetical protein
MMQLLDLLVHAQRTRVEVFLKKAWQPHANAATQVRLFLLVLRCALDLGCTSEFLGTVFPLFACVIVSASRLCNLPVLARLGHDGEGTFMLYIRCCLLAFSIFVACPYLTSL